MSWSQESSSLEDIALASVLRALTRYPAFQVSYLPTRHLSFRVEWQEQQVRLPHLASLMEEYHFDTCRGIYDQAAAFIRFHDDTLWQQETAAYRHLSPILDAMERLRCSLLLCYHYQGSMQNIKEALITHYRRSGALQLHMPMALEDKWVLAFFHSHFSLLTAKDQEALLPALNRHISPFIMQSKHWLTKLSAQLEHQSGYLQVMLAWLTSLQQENNDQDGLSDSEQNESKEPPRENAEVEQEAQDEGVTESAQEESAAEESSASAAGTGTNPQALGQAEGAEDDMADDAAEESSMEVPHYPDAAAAGVAGHARHYAAFITAHDEVVSADQLSSDEELVKLKHRMDKHLPDLQLITRRLAGRLQRKLLVKQSRSWSFHKEEGVLDGARLAEMVANPTFQHYWKEEQQSDELNTHLTLLIDNSGSMRGRPITVAGLSADVIASTMERCGVSVEVLGFTTKEWKGGAARKDWEQAGKPEHPGRLNDLRHIIYKASHQSMRRVRHHLGLMLKEGILKENIDGEALLWAAERLERRPEKRKILMVISDGAPVDDSTVSANHAHFLDQHLHQVIHDIERSSHIQLMAIGIGHDVSRYYRHAVTIHDVDQLASTMINELSGLFGVG